MSASVLSTTGSKSRCDHFYTNTHPEEAFAICRKVIPEITEKEAPVQLQVLQASVYQKIAVNLPRPRSEEIEYTPEFVNLTYQIRRAIKA